MAQARIANPAIVKRIPAVVNGPRPEKAILIATALEPKIMHKNDVKRAVKRGSS